MEAKGISKAKKVLLFYSEKEIFIQQHNKSKIVDAFKIFWKSNPNERDFSKYMTGLVIFAEIMYFMIKGDN